jgi:hypothetical protein
MPGHPTFDDPILGRVNRDARDGCWNFNVGPINGESVEAIYIPEDSRLPPAEQGWDGVRASVLWIRANAPSGQQFLIQRASRPSGSAMAPLLSTIHSYKDQEARLIYYDSGGLAIVHVNAAGQIVGGPVLIGLGGSST